MTSNLSSASQISKEESFFTQNYPETQNIWILPVETVNPKAGMLFGPYPQLTKYSHINVAVEMDEVSQNSAVSFENEIPVQIEETFLKIDEIVATPVYKNISNDRQNPALEPKRGIKAFLAFFGRT